MSQSDLINASGHHVSQPCFVSPIQSISFSNMFQFKWAYISQSCFNAGGHIFLNYFSIQMGIY